MSIPPFFSTKFSLYLLKYDEGRKVPALIYVKEN